jgi:acetoin utilization protein AcuB
MKDLRVRDLMSDHVVSVHPGNSVDKEAARIMFENKLGCLPVTEGWRLVGILTESDFVKYFTRRHANDNGLPS